MHHVLKLGQIAAWPPFRDCVGTPAAVVADVPSLQRGLVWSPGQVELLWDSLMRGFPVGSMVICRKMADEIQDARHTVVGPERDLVSHYLLDGQQRAQTIRLGYQDPFESELVNRAQILWLDLDPRKMWGTRSFLFRVATKAHPWGFGVDDKAAPVSLHMMRQSLEQCGLGNDVDNFPIRPTPLQCWPIDASVPIPFGWLAREAATGETSFWPRVRARAADMAAAHPGRKWAAKVDKFLGEAEVAGLDRIRDGVFRALVTEIVCLELPPDALSSESQRERESNPEEVTNVEHLFQRLNGGGTTLSPDDLAYSMIKAHWPGLDKNIEALAKTRRLPEARLVTLASRLPLVDRDGENPKISTEVKIGQLRKLGMGKKEAKLEFARFFQPGEECGLAPLLDQIGQWCGSANIDGSPGLPFVIQTSIAVGSRDVYALLLWMADRAIRLPGTASDEALRKPVQGLITALHWFGVDKNHAADAAMNALLQHPALTPTAFSGVLRCPGMEVDGWWRSRVPPSLKDLGSAMQIDGPLERWGWRNLLEREEVGPTMRECVRAVVENREMLIYAQRTFLAKRFGGYDPADRETWHLHSRPWDFDHILASAYLPHRKYKHKETVKQWLGSIGNLRVWPREDNRSDQDLLPEKKVYSMSRLDESFLCKVERDGLARGVEALKPSIEDTSHLRAFVNAARGRVLRIYGAWWGTDGLDIAYLTQAREAAST